MGCHVAPLVQCGKVVPARRVRRVGIQFLLQVEPEPVEVPGDIVDVRVAVIQAAMRGELILDQQLRLRRTFEAMIWAASVYRSRQNP